MFNPLLAFLAIFVAAPLIELYVLIEVGSEIGALPTILLSIFTALLGGFMVRVQGVSVLFRAQQQMARQEPPTIEMLEGVMLVLVGLALLLPGFITDAVGFILLIPAIRRTVILSMLRSRGVMRPGTSSAPDSVDQKGYIEGEFRRDDDQSSR